MSHPQEKDEKWLAKLEKRFNVIAGDDNQIDLDEFKAALNVKKSFFAERFFELIDADRSGAISLKELIGALRLLVHGTATEKLLFLFQVYDADGSGYIDFEELKTVLHSCTAESALTLSDETLTELTEVLFDDADVDGDGQVSFEELSKQLERYPAITENLTISAADWLNPRCLDGSLKRKTRIRKALSSTATCCSYETLRNHLTVVAFVLAYTLLNAALAVWGAFEGYWGVKDGQHPAPLIIARSTGRCLSFNSCFVLVLMLRKLLTICRNSFLNTLLPLDHHFDIHKIVGFLMIAFSVVHIIGHVLNFVLIVRQDVTNTTLVEFLVAPVPGVGWVYGTSSLTGWLLAIVLAVITVFAMPCIRRHGYFKVFFWTHQLCIVFWGLLILHSQTFWIWFVAPGMVYCVERVLRLQMYRRARFGITYIQEGFILPANVVHIVIQRPPNFKFQAGEYIYVNIPSIASHEWHPFTISSAPEQQEFLSLHVRALGHWTKRLYDVFKQREESKLQQLDLSSENDDADDPSDPLRQAGGEPEKPLEVLAEEGALRGSRAFSISGSPLSQKGSRSPSKRSPRKRNVSGETNSGYEPESPEGLTESSEVEMLEAGSQCSSNKQEQISHEMLPLRHSRKNSLRHSLPGLIDIANAAATSAPEAVPRAGKAPLAETEALSEQSLPSVHIRKRDKKFLPLVPSNAVDSMEGPTQVTTFHSSNGHRVPLDTTCSSPAQITRTDSGKGQAKRPESGPTSHHQRTLSKRTSDSTGMVRRTESRKQSRMKMRRRNTLHSLGAARSLGGTPHTGMEIILDGPYGSPAQHIMEAEHAVLIGAGIGITPFASILQSIHERYKAAKKHCPNCNHAWVEDASSILKTKKVDFFWINRQQRSFEWFISLLNNIEMEQAEIPVTGRFLDIHLYMTSALSPSDMKAIGLHVALDLIHKKHKRDTITGLMTRTQPGRPDWEEVFQNLKQSQKGRITVFFCGSPALGKIIRNKCLQYKMDFRKENF